MNIAEKKLKENVIEAKKIYLPNKTSRYFYKNEIKIPKKTLVLLCGIPRSGKTTLAQKICKQFNNAVHINIDYLFDCATKELYPNFKYVGKEALNCIAKNAFDNAYTSAGEALEQEKIVVWDDLEIFPTDRAEVLKALKDKYAYSILIVIKCDNIMRSIKRGDTQNITRLVQATQMYLQIQLLKPRKYFIGFDEVYIVKKQKK